MITNIQVNYKIYAEIPNKKASLLIKTALRIKAYFLFCRQFRLWVVLSSCKYDPIDRFRSGIGIFILFYSCDGEYGYGFFTGMQYNPILCGHADLHSADKLSVQTEYRHAAAQNERYK